MAVPAKSLLESADRNFGIKFKNLDDRGGWKIEKQRRAPTGANATQSLLKFIEYQDMHPQ